eukprot:scaffold26569_cov107-Isochrysis_galbana.AAC.9
MDSAIVGPSASAASETTGGAQMPTALRRGGDRAFVAEDRARNSCAGRSGPDSADLPMRLKLCLRLVRFV